MPSGLRDWEIFLKIWKNIRGIDLFFLQHFELKMAFNIELLNESPKVSELQEDTALSVALDQIATSYNALRDTIFGTGYLKRKERWAD